MLVKVVKTKFMVIKTKIKQHLKNNQNAGVAKSHKQ